MTSHGKLPEFDPAVEPWSSYVERLEFYFVANDIVENTKKRAILLTACSPSTFELLRSLVQPHKPSDKTYAELVTQLSEHYHPKPSEIVQRFKFNTRDREPSESVSSYVASLKSLAEHCNFGDSLNSMLRDRLVCGVKDIGIQKRLLQETDLTFQKSFEIAQGIETANRNAKDLQPGTTQSQLTVQRVAHTPQQSNRTPTATCYRCGGTHAQHTCRFRDTTCHSCGKRGHISRVCRSKAATQNRSSSTQNSSRTKPARTMKANPDRKGIHSIDTTQQAAGPPCREASLRGRLYIV